MSENGNPEYFLFPIRNEQGFRVVDTDSYAHLMSFIVSVATELEVDYPDKTIWVTYRTGDE